MLQPRVTDHRPFLGLMLALVVLAWLALTLWSFSPYARFLNHEILHELPFAITAEYLTLMLVFVAGWTLMTVAMMLLTSLPLVMLFRRLTQKRPDHLKLVGLLIVGYLAVWAFFGGLAHFGDLFVHEAVHRFPWLGANPWAFSAVLLTAAGIYQFTPLKYKCLDKCRSPYSFIAEHWRGQNQRLQSLWLGIRHGAYCVGCCWSLMLLMFAFACGNIAWMLILGAVMAAEKNLPWGRKLSAPLGILLIASGWLVVLMASPFL
jgi:predicted metal-binding membrane protein